MKADMQPKRIAIAVPPDAQSLDVFGPLDVFIEATRQSGGAAVYDTSLVAIERGGAVRTGGVSLVVEKSIYDSDAPYDTLLVAGSPDFSRAEFYADFQQWLRQRAAEVPRYGSVCTGAFFLGAAGLLDGRKVTTHWQHAAELAARYPAARVEPDQIYVKDGPLYTSAGVTAGIDLALRLVEDDHGRELALAVARRLVVFLKRPGGQSQFSAHLAAQIASETRIQSLQHWILENLDTNLSIAALAKRAAMSVRNLTRVFLSETGVTPTDYVEAARLDAARRLLEDTDVPLQRVASRCGFGNADTMRRTFLRRIGTGPHDYRARFRS
jgi:transcriptional regulator GlxA family with amidase domain